MSEKLTPEAHAPQEIKEGEPKIEKLTINDFAREIGLQPDQQGRTTFGPEHDRLAYEYAEKFARDKNVIVLNNNYGAFYYTTRDVVNNMLNADRSKYVDIPTNFTFNEYLPDSAPKDRKLEYFDNRGSYSNLTVFPCNDADAATYALLMI